MKTYKINTSDLYRLCNKHNFCTCASISQYKTLFEISKNGVTELELCKMLLVLSDTDREMIFCEIQAAVTDLIKDY